MPKNASLLAALRSQYGADKGEHVYYAMESEGTPAFRRGLATARREGHLTRIGLSRSDNPVGRPREHRTRRDALQRADRRRKGKHG